MSDLIADTLRNAPLFSALDSAVRAAIMPFLHRLTLEAGEVVFYEGDAGDELYVVGRGEVHAYVGLADGSRRQVGEFLSGDFFGEMAVFEVEPRSATCLAEVETQVVRISREDLEEISQTHPGAAARLLATLLRVIHDRLREKSSFLAEMVVWGEDASRRVITDDLTGVYNRLYLERTLAERCRSAGAEGRALSVAMADVDDFRKINEKLGQSTGDELLKGIAHIMKGCLGEGDLVARYGGDEFTLVFDGLEAPAARSICERICNAIRETTSLPAGGSIDARVTLSMGVAAYPTHSPEPSRLRELADRALYTAKEQGKDQVTTAEN